MSDPKKKVVAYTALWNQKLIFCYPGEQWKYAGNGVLVDFGDETPPAGNEQIWTSLPEVPASKEVMSDRPTCETCPFWETVNLRDGDWGQCHRFPPQIPDGEVDNAFLHFGQTFKSDWCGEHPDFPAWIKATKVRRCVFYTGDGRQCFKHDGHRGAHSFADPAP